MKEQFDAILSQLDELIAKAERINGYLKEYNQDIKDMVNDINLT